MKLLNLPFNNLKTKPKQKTKTPKTSTKSSKQKRQKNFVCHFVGYVGSPKHAMIPGGDREEEEAGERRAKRSKGGESPRPVQGTEARTLAQLPEEMQPDLLKKIYESTKSNHITPLCVNRQRTNTYFR